MSNRTRGWKKKLLAVFLALWVPVLLLAAYDGYARGRIRFPSRLGDGEVFAHPHPLPFYFTLCIYVAIGVGLGVVAWRLWRSSR